jgi:hypothetical protein
MENKVCITCKEEKPKTEYSKNLRNKDKLENNCRPCVKEKYDNTKDSKSKAQKKWRENNKNYQKEWRSKNPDRIEYEKEYYKKNKEKYDENKKNWRKNNPDKEKKIRDKYKKEKSKEINDYHRKWKANKRLTDMQYKIKENISRRIRYELTNISKTKNKKTIEYIDCDIQFLKIYLESKFEFGMSWANYGKLWHIDHIIPCNYWNLENDVDNYLCWNYRNLQPLWAFSNKSKRDTVNMNKVLYYKVYMETLI